ncbi:hypothetical protein ERIC1_1c10280 [Paenibacillus larvae subsp. larvae DSM 25719]|uniref:Uncharacterized protein n=1 Tax=Paenibacillus larvae subsp. larvae DSM 25430 TaxID=697284 RepID=V9W8F8_9BACL|nr:hypothetical protein ERIC2_c24110 [Paenibacillus larvae subsp. larvae DSM 25430]AVG12742.1 hypothetical protein ERICII_02375 [Paenibacillus larvae subsp. larvae DSM 25430]ETK27582.1 hypothetical protein ERIC1_1c10280 [Paenibacillus larvae subsp. larvae DSM 25719]
MLWRFFVGFDFRVFGCRQDCQGVLRKKLKKALTKALCNHLTQKPLFLQPSSCQRKSVVFYVLMLNHTLSAYCGYHHP